MKNAKGFLIKYGLTTVIAGLVTLLTLELHGFAEAEAAVDRYKLLADAFTIPGVILVMLSALVWISTDGFFDGLTYAFSRFSGMLFPSFQKKYHHESYYDYKMSKKGKRLSGYGFLFFVGLAFVAVAVVFTCLHASVYVPEV